ncbi:riboflavin synthase [Anaerotardibacter muris]|uniref:riboflavin synthase n=1 Tax=Anaerotardibacter muris TaxID=2941505 RepID=UPI00203C1819|nr:riboflavin synthase [Anaerotardibacter muris]
MFTGIVEAVGTVKMLKRGANSAIITIEAPQILGDAHMGDSIAVNGVCLTVTSFTNKTFDADIMHETLDRSDLGSLRAGSKVNVERAMAVNGRFGGHIVSGHIDGVGKIARIETDDNAVWFTIAAPQHILRQIILKGSIAIDGISLTVARLTDSTFSVSVIPHTRAETNLVTKHVGDEVNLETDVIGKYVERLLSFEGADRSSPPQPSGEITKEFLLMNGF